MDYLLDEMPLHAILGFSSMPRGRRSVQAIKDGTSEEQVAIPRERLIGCAEAVETHKVAHSECKGAANRSAADRPALRRRSERGRVRRGDP